MSWEGGCGGILSLVKRIDITGEDRPTNKMI